MKTVFCIVAAAAAMAACSGSSAPGATAAAEAGLPLKPGFYNQGESCADASNASIALLGRHRMNWSQASCALTSIQKTSATSWRAMQACTGIRDGVEEPAYPAVFEIRDQTTFSYQAGGSDSVASFRFCEQASLPEPWRSNDISDLIN